jgi:hypothetical protein
LGLDATRRNSTVFEATRLTHFFYRFRQKEAAKDMERMKQELQEEQQALLLRTKPVPTLPTKPVRGGLKIQTAKSSSDSFGPKKGSSSKKVADAKNSSNSR